MTNATDMTGHNSGGDRHIAFDIRNICRRGKPVLMKRDPMIRFAEKTIAKCNGCIEWIGHLSPKGYGQFSWLSRPVCAHRWVYAAKKGPIPVGMVIDHLCRNPACVNIDHLECVSMAENTRRGLLHTMQRAKARAMTHCKRGYPLFGQNVSINAKGHRCCKTCQRKAAEEWKVINRDRVNEMQRRRRAAGGR